MIAVNSSTMYCTSSPSPTPLRIRTSGAIPTITIPQRATSILARGPAPGRSTSSRSCESADPATSSNESTVDMIAETMAASRTVPSNRRERADGDQRHGEVAARQQREEPDGGERHEEHQEVHAGGEGHGEEESAPHFPLVPHGVEAHQLLRGRDAAEQERDAHGEQQHPGERPEGERLGSERLHRGEERPGPSSRRNTIGAATSAPTTMTTSWSRSVYTTATIPPTAV